MQISNIQIDIGLLWNEAEITGEFDGEFEVIVTTLSGKAERFTAESSNFRARAPRSHKKRTFGIRLEESLSEERAQEILAHALSVSGSFKGDVIEAGVHWSENLDGRVWWPVLAAGSLSDAEELLHDLREKTNLEPLALSIVPMDSQTDAPFHFTIGEMKIEATRVACIPRAKNIFHLDNIPIGRGFHWERKERLSYRGQLHLFASPEQGLTAANRLSLETYLHSTVFSEMGADLPDAFLAAQAIAARSTVLATAGRHHRGDGFHLCNDDHCQCYQGVSREPDDIHPAIGQTAGQILTYENKPADARYAKSCGGMSETYDAVWGGEGPAYLMSLPCGEVHIDNLKDERTARDFLHQKLAAFCNDEFYPYPERWSEEIPFRWQRDYSAKELENIIQNKTQVEIGALREFRPLVRGASGRILILEIIGSKRTLKLYRELEIRRALSPSHLPSSCFIIEPQGKGPDRFTIIGGGWGHGVGLCQLGAVAMANQGMSTENILDHYYQHTSIFTQT